MSSSNFLLQTISTKCIYGILVVLLTWLISTKKDYVFAFKYQHNQQNLNKNPPCEHPIYCIGGPGTILHTVQMAKVYNDSKTFVDKPLKHDPTQTIENFRVFMMNHHNSPPKEDLKIFIDQNFHEEGSDFMQWIPTDWKRNISLFTTIKDPNYTEFSKKIHKKWLSLGRKSRLDVRDNPSLHSLIYVENPVIVPGGRFRECYYWDSYWTILGLLVSEMDETVKGMLHNFSSLISEYGMIPNGNRVYFSKRSQPPLFIAMVDAYYEKTKDLALVRELIDKMETEFMFWIENRMITVIVRDEEHILAHYISNVSYPRPESYYEDYTDATKFFSDEHGRHTFYTEMKAGAESGWDYSSKWFISSEGGISSHLKDIHTSDIIPVELNSFLCHSARVLAKFYSMLNRHEKAQQFNDWGNSFQYSMNAVFWDEEHGTWFDYDNRSKKPRKVFYASNLMPLWAECYSQTKHLEKVKKVIKYLDENGALEYPGGIPTSLIRSGQQWDFSNAWPPLQHLVVAGLMKSGDKSAELLGINLVKKWIRSNYIGFSQTNGTIFEKYDAEKVGVPGHAGEYTVQEGFGWTNGVILNFLSQYGDIISSEDNMNILYQERSTMNRLTLISILFTIIFIAMFIFHIFKKKRRHFILLPAIAINNFYAYFRLYSK